MGSITVKEVMSLAMDEARRGKKKSQLETEVRGIEKTGAMRTRKRNGQDRRVGGSWRERGEYIMCDVSFGISYSLGFIGLQIVLTNIFRTQMKCTS